MWTQTVLAVAVGLGSFEDLVPQAHSQIATLHSIRNWLSSPKEYGIGFDTVVWLLR
jgi:hypothetical protein